MDFIIVLIIYIAIVLICYYKGKFDKVPPPPQQAPIQQNVSINYPSFQPKERKILVKDVLDDLPREITRVMSHGTYYMDEATIQATTNLLETARRFPKKCYALDCEMVGTGCNGQTEMLARVSIVDQNKCIYDEYVKPYAAVTDYRRYWSGITEGNLINGKDFDDVQNDVFNILSDYGGCILIGHDIQFDLKTLFLVFPDKYIRDTSNYCLFLRDNGQKHSLKYLAQQYLNRTIQEGRHDCQEDADAAMDLYLLFKTRWENEIQQGL